MKIATSPIKYLTLLLVCFLTLMNVGAESGGMSFDGEKVYRMEKPPTAPINTVEVTLFFPYDMEGKGGVIMSSFNLDSQPYLSVEADVNGNPLIAWRGKYGVEKYTFGDVDLYCGEWIRLTITRDVENGVLKCYVDGILAQTINLVGLVSPEESYGASFTVGGDRKAGNTDYFKGRIKKAKGYYDVRNAYEILSDAPEANDNSDIAFCYDMTDLKSDGNGYIIPDKSGNGYDLVTNVDIPSVDSSVNTPINSDVSTTDEIVDTSATSEAQNKDPETSCTVTTEADSTAKDDVQTTPTQTTAADTEGSSAPLTSTDLSSTVGSSVEETTSITVQRNGADDEELETYFLVIAGVCALIISSSLILVILATRKKK